MTGEVLHWIYGAGVAQGLFLMLALASLNVRDGWVRGTLLVIIGLFTLLLVPEWLNPADERSSLQLDLVMELGLAPLLYLFVRALRGDPSPALSRMILYFSPLIAAVLLVGLVNILDQSGALPFDPDRREIVASVIFAKQAYFLTFAVILLRLPLSMSSQGAKRRSALLWVKRWLWLFSASYAYGSLQYAAFYFGIPGVVDPDPVGAVILTVSIFWLGYFILANRDVFDRREVLDPESLAGREMAQLVARARELLRSERLYRDPDFGLGQFARALVEREGVLSSALNSAVEGGFYAMINEHRLDDFAAAAEQPQNRDCPILELALDAGFNSKTTFYRLFRARYAKTPLAWRADIIAGKERTPERPNELDGTVASSRNLEKRHSNQKGLRKL